MKKTILFLLRTIFSLILFLSVHSLQAQNILLTGKVTEVSGEPLPGANIVVKGTTKGIVTDLNGNYSLNVNSSDVLVFSFVGYLTKEIKLTGEATLNVVLTEDSRNLDELVVIGYGSQKKSDLTGSITSVSSDKLENIAVTRIDDILQGQSSGVQIDKVNGAPGGGIKIRIRGTNSITGNNQPLVVIDEYIGGSLETLNPDDIESIQILKDASATAIYGSRASNGVVIVTTKKGSVGAPKIEFKSFVTASRVRKKFDLMNAGDYATTVNEKAEVFGKSPVFSQQEIDDFYLNGGTDWQDEVFRTGITQNYSLSAKGGSEKSKYFISGSYLDEEGIVINSSNRQFSGRINFDLDLSDKLKVGINVFSVYQEDHNVSNQGYSGTAGSILLATSYAPTIPVWNEETNDYSEPSAIYGPIGDNPVYKLKERNFENKNLSLNLTGYLKYQITDWLSFKTSAVVNKGANNGVGFNRYTPSQISANSQSIMNNTHSYGFQNTNILNFNKKFGDNLFDISLIYEHSHSKKTFNSINATQLTTMALEEFSIPFGESLTADATLTASQLESYFGRFNYSYKERYLFTGTYRIDGSSKFQKGNRYSTFPSVALAWRMQEEKFIKDLDVFYSLKLRASYGATGNQGISSYATLPTLGTGYNYPFVNGTTSPSIGVVPANIANPDLKWETTYQTNVGVDYGFFNNRLYGSIDWYKKNTEDLLLQVIIPTFNGVGTMLKNIGEVENKGWEFSLGAIPVDTKDLKWEINGNISFNKNKIISLLDPENPEEQIFTVNNMSNRLEGGSQNVLIEGQPIGMLWGMIYKGPWSIEDTEEAALYGRVPGDANFADLDDDKIYNDFTIVGDPNPDFTWGLSSSLSYKNFDLSVIFVGSHGQDKWDYARWQTLTDWAGINNETSVEILDRWSPTNQDSDIPAFSTTNRWSPQNSYFVEDASFIKMKDITLGYLWRPQNVKVISGVRLYVSGQNLLLITDYKGYDPEVDGAGANPSGDAGMDSGSYPNARGVTFGVKLSF